MGEKRKIIVRFGGGLGNQIYQYVFFLYLKEHLSTDFDIICDIFSYNLFNEHLGFEIANVFDFSEKILKDKDLRFFRPAHYYADKTGVKCVIDSLSRYRYICGAERIINNIKKSIGCKSYQIISQKNPTLLIDIIKVIEEKQVDVYIEGNWQNIYYYQMLSDAAKEKLRIRYVTPEIKLLNEIQNCNSISIHIRRKDYINNPRLNIVDESYYKKAIQIIKSKVDNPSLYIFTDDKEYANRMFRNTTCRIVSTGTPYDDFVLMSKCKHNIIPNSSFSYWAAILNDNPDKIVIAPCSGINNMGDFLKYSVPSDWITINNSGQ